MNFLQEWLSQQIKTGHFHLMRLPSGQSNQSCSYLLQTKNLHPHFFHSPKNTLHPQFFLPKKTLKKHLSHLSEPSPPSILLLFFLFGWDLKPNFHPLPFPFSPQQKTNQASPKKCQERYELLEGGDVAGRLAKARVREPGTSLGAVGLGEEGGVTWMSRVQEVNGSMVRINGL